MLTETHTTALMFNVFKFYSVTENGSEWFSVEEKYQRYLYGIYSIFFYQ